MTSGSPIALAMLMLAGGSAWAEPPVPAPSPEPPPVSAGLEGFGFQSAGGALKVRIGALLQVDGRFHPGDPGAVGTDTFLVRRARPIVQGTVGNRYDFRLTPDFGDGKTVIQDAYLDARFASWLRLRVGKFKAPVGLERLQSVNNLYLIDRAFPTAVAPNRDVGVVA